MTRGRFDMSAGTMIDNLWNSIADEWQAATCDLTPPQAVFFVFSSWEKCARRNLDMMHFHIPPSPLRKKIYIYIHIFGQPEYAPRQRNKQEWADTVAWRLLFQSQVVIIELRHWPATKFCFCFFLVGQPVIFFFFRPRFQVTIMQYIYFFF